MPVANIIFMLCVLSSSLCAMLMLYAYERFRKRILLWILLCMIFLAINNILLYLDVVLPEIDLSVARNTTAFLGLSILVFGLIWDIQ